MLFKMLFEAIQNAIRHGRSGIPSGIHTALAAQLLPVAGLDHSVTFLVSSGVDRSDRRADSFGKLALWQGVDFPSRQLT